MGHANPQKLFAFHVRLWAATALAIVVCACSPATVHIVTSPEFRGEVVTPIVILPFQLDSLKDSTRQFQLSNSDVTPTATAVVTDLFYKNLSKKSAFSLIPLDRVNAAVDAFTLPLLDRDPSYEIARKIGEVLEAKTVLVGSVSQYRDRVGNAFGISRPASVGFEARLVSVIDGETLWEGHFFETQRPMTSDLQGFLQRRRWLTAEELAEDGVKQILDQGWE
jgi:hypothetical protein